MYASSESTLPRYGFGSERWFDQVFNVENEYRKAMAILAKGFGADAVIKNLFCEVFTHTTEWGAGREALTIQPPINYIVKRDAQGTISLYVEKLSELGEQLYEYQTFKDMPVAASKGLQTALNMLFDLRENEGVALLSPYNFYKNSTGDVVDAFFVRTPTSKLKNGEETLSVTGWFLFTNKKLSKEERQYWLDCHDITQQTKFDGTPEDIVQKPQYWQPVTDNSEEDNPVLEYTKWLDNAFKSKFGKNLFSSNRQDSLKRTLAKLVGNEIGKIKDLLLRREKIPLLEKIWELMEKGQNTWCELMGIDYDWYWSQVLQGEIQIIGFHPAGDMDDDGNELLDNNESSGYCKKHGHYRGSRCPKCKN